jgi:GT2 family glycosyltransferase
VEVEIIVINNDEQLIDRSQLGLTGDAILRIIEINENVGFGKAHNAGFRESRGDFVLFLNPDAKIVSKAIENMLRAISEGQKVGIVAPLLVDATGKVDPNCFGGPRTPFSTLLEKIFLKKNMGASGRDVFETDWVSGGAMLIKRDVFEALDGFDENFFMYFEDVDLCRRATFSGHKVVVHPDARVFHESGKSFASEREKKRHYYASQDYYIQKHFGCGWKWFVKLIRLPYTAGKVWLRK